MDVYQRRRLVALSAIAAIFIVFVLLIKSCGGDDPTTPTPLAGATGLGGATVLAQSDYISQADAICLEANTSLAGVDQSDPSQAASDEADIIAGELQQLQSLPPPDDGTTKLDNFLKALDKQATAYQDRTLAVQRGDDAAVAELATTIDSTGSDAASVAKKFGFKVCGDTSKVGDASSTGDSGGSVSTTDTGAVETPTTTPVAPAPTTTPVTPVTPAPTDGGGATPAPAPTDTFGGTDSGSGGVSP